MDGRWYVTTMAESTSQQTSTVDALLSRASAKPTWENLLAALGVKQPIPQSLTKGILEAAERRPLGFRFALRDGQVPGLALRVGARGGAGIWWFAFRAQDGRREMLKLDVVAGADPRVARHAAASVIARLRSGENPAQVHRIRRSAEREERSKLTLRDFVEGDYWRLHLRLLKDNGATKARILFAFSDLLDRPLASITKEDIEEILTRRRAGGLAAGTVHREWQSLRAALGFAVERGHLPAVPVHKLPKPLRGWRPAQRMRYVGERGPEERSRVAETLAAFEKRMNEGDDRARLLVFYARLGWATGMRRGEILGLRASELAESAISLPPHRTKAGRERVIRLNADAKQALKLWKLRSPAGEFFPDYLDDKGRAGTSMAAWRGKLDRIWKEFCEEARVIDLHKHDLRHTFATDLRLAGAPLEVVRDAVGHADLKMTQRYAHVGKDEVANAVDRLKVP